MRSVSFVKHLTFKVKGKVFHDCMALGDVDGDNCNELVVAETDGILKIYKGADVSPWLKYDNLGDISCIAVGDVCNQGRNSVLVFTVDGDCTIFDIQPQSNTTPMTSIKSERLALNICNVLVGDIDKDGKQELVLCHSDKAVSAYRWNDRLKKFILLQLWKLQHLVGNVTLHFGAESGEPTLMISQPGCSYAVLKFSEKSGVECDEVPNNDSQYVNYMQLSSLSRLQNPAVSCRILGDITKCGDTAPGYFALCTLDGTLKLMEENNILWSVQVDHQLFALGKMDVLGDNREEVIVCAWDGFTYIVDHDRNVVKYQFPDNVQAFCAGNYSIDGKTNVPCLVYVDFHNSISLYYDVKLPFLRATDFVSFAENDEDVKEAFKKLGLTTAQEKSEILKRCLMDNEITDS